MEGDRKVSRSFRKLLRGEMSLWRDDGILSPEQFDALHARYALGDLEKEHTSAFVAVIYAIGAILIGGGVITFVAAYWEVIPRASRVVLIVAAMLAAYATGYWLWRVRGTRPTLGHALVVLGTLIFGANIGLVAQIYHISGDWFNGFAAWSVGALVMAYGALSVPNAVIAVVTSFVWFCGFSERFGFEEGRFLLLAYPLVVLAASLPLAYLKRSGVLFFFVLLAFGVSVFVFAMSEGETNPVLSAVSASLALFLGAYGAFHKTVKPRPEVASTALVFSGIALGLWSYVFSFKPRYYGFYSKVHWSSEQTKAIVALAIIIAVAGIVLAALSFTRIFAKAALRAYVFPLWAGVLLMFLLLAAEPFSGDGTIITVLSNCALVVLAAGCVWAGVLSLKRAPFWLGVGLIGLEIITRFLEYETSLTAKAAVFLVLGIAVIAGGVRFESIVRSRGAVHE